LISSKEQDKYQRQITISGFGIEGQQKLKNAKILVAGAGGLGAPVSLYLAAAGVGTIRIVDSDMVAISNLNRQILYTEADTGKRKASVAQERLHRANSDINVESVDTIISPENVLALAAGCDLIIDALDNYPTRYLMNKAALESNIPFVHAGVYALDGMITTIVPGKTACLRCIFPEPPLPITTPVLGVVPGIMGCLQALEAIKYLIGIGELVTGRMLLVDGFGTKFNEVRVQRNPQCLDCRMLW